MTALLSGCGGGTSIPISSGPLVSVTRTNAMLQFTLTATKSVYVRGETIPFSFSVKNAGVQPSNIAYNDYFVDIVVTKGSQQIDLFPGTNLDSIIGITVAPRAISSQNITWDQTDANNKQLPSGQYTIIGYLPIRSLNGMDLLMNLPPANWQSFWQTNYASNPITITIR